MDYWDAIAWKDRYADPLYSARQHRYATRQAARTVYTPAFVVNGESWRPGLLSRTQPASDQQVGALNVSVEQGQITADFDSLVSLTAPLHLYVALLGMDLKTQIKAGENTGRTTGHLFVVLGLARASSAGTHWQLT